MTSAAETTVTVPAWLSRNAALRALGLGIVWPTLSSTTSNERRNEPDSHPLPPTRPSILTKPPLQLPPPLPPSSPPPPRYIAIQGSCLHAAYLRAGPALHQIHSPLHARLRDTASHQSPVFACSSAVIIFYPPLVTRAETPFPLTLAPTPIRLSAV